MSETNGHTPREPASDRTSVRRVDRDGAPAFRLRAPDGAEAYVSAWMLSDLLHDERTRQQARRELWDSPIPFTVVEGG